MTKIILTVARNEVNPEYEKEKDRRYFQGDTPSPYVKEEILRVELTEAQFEAIRKEVLKAF